MEKVKSLMKKIPLKKVILTLILGFCVIFVASKAIHVISGYWKIRHYEQTAGTVMACAELRTGSTGGGRTGAARGITGSRSTYYISTIEYQVDGVVYKLYGPVLHSKEIIGMGKTVYYNPKNPADSVLKEEVDDTANKLFAYSLPLLIIGGIVGFVVLVEVISKRIGKMWKKRKNRNQF